MAPPDCEASDVQATTTVSLPLLGNPHDRWRQQEGWRRRTAREKALLVQHGYRVDEQQRDIEDVA